MSISKQDSIKSDLEKELSEVKPPMTPTRFLHKTLIQRFYTLSRITIIDFVTEKEKTIRNSDLDEDSKYLWLRIDAMRHEHENNLDEKIRILQKCYDYFSKDKSSSDYLNTTYSLGEVNYRLGRAESAVKYLSEMKELLPSMDHPMYSVTIRKLSRTYSQIGQVDTAIELMDDLIDHYEGKEDFKWDSKHLRHYLVISGFYSKKGDNREAIRLAEIVLEKANKKNATIIYNNCKSSLARHYFKIGDVTTSKKYAEEAHTHYEILKRNYPSMINSRLMLGKIYYHEGNFRKSKNFYEEALALSRKHKYTLDESSALKGIINCNINLGEDLDTTTDKLEEYIAIRDTVYNKDMITAVEDLKQKYATEKREASIRNLNEQKTQAEESLKVAKRNNVLLALLTGLVLLSILMLSWLYRRKTISENLLSEKSHALEKSLDEKKLLLKEIHHRVKNNLQTVSSLLSLQSNYIKDENVLDALKDGQNRVQSMALIHQNLYQEDDLQNIKVKTYFEKLIHRLYQSYQIDRNRIQLTMDVDDVKADIETIIPLGLITNELVSNVFKYAFSEAQEGRLFVALKRTTTSLNLTVKDNGRGIDPIILESENSFGYQMIKAFCQKLDAQLNINNKEGTEIMISINKYQT